MSIKTIIMKTTNQFLILFAIVLLSFSFNSCKNDNKKSKDITITLHVDTENVKQNNTSTTCNFGQPANISNEEYLVKANVGDNITWVGSAIPPSEGNVIITKIVHQGGPNVFDRNEISGNGKLVIGKLKNKTKKDSLYKYKIFFKVNGKEQQYHIDPKLEVEK